MQSLSIRKKSRVTEEIITGFSDVKKDLNGIIEKVNTIGFVGQKSPGYCGNANVNIARQYRQDGYISNVILYRELQVSFT